MAVIQRYFDEFNEAIKLKRFEQNQTLREKRDAVRNRVTDRLPSVFKAHGEGCPAYSWRDQGSYEMGTGVQPLDGDFDIDQGLYVAVSTADYPDPVVLKQRVHEALDGHTDSVLIRRPCVTVQYHRAGEAVYHVDIAVYSDGATNADRKARLAVGKVNSAPEYRSWDISDPEGLTALIFTRFVGNDRRQFRRIVRYLKRWKAVNFATVGRAAPLGIALSVAAYNNLRTSYADAVAGMPDDLQALRDLVRAMAGQFTATWDVGEQQFVRRLAVRLPVEPRADLCERMTGKQMGDFEDALTALRDALDAAASDVAPEAACARLQKVFGDDFPVPEKRDTGRVHAPAIVTSSNNG